MTVGEILKSVGVEWIENKRGSNNNNPRVTVILPTFRRAKSGTFEKAVESVIAQSYENWELIIVDDASTDGTKELIQFYMELDSRISTIRHLKNVGLPAISEYEGYCRAKGEYIAFIFDDNVWEKDHLMLAMKTMLKENVKFTYGITKIFDKNGAIEIGWNIDFLPGSNFIGNGAVVVHRDIIEDVGFFDPHVLLTRICDWDLWVRIHRKYEMKLIPQIVTNEYGVILKDSLGNTVKLNSWAAFERMNMNRNESLRRGNFEKVDICEVKEINTDLYFDMITNFYQQYSAKIWYVPLEFKVLKAKTRAKRVLILTNEVSATYSLTFRNFGENIIARPLLYTAFNEQELFYVDYVLFCRNAALALQYIPYCKKYKIPFGFYLDDNFIEMIKCKDIDEDNPGYGQVVQMKEALLSDKMFMFKNFFVSTDTLKKYFGELGLRRIDVLGPTVSEKEFKKINLISNKEVTVSFFGGAFREEEFIKLVLPALINLSKKYNIRLVCPETLKELLENKFDKELDAIELCFKKRNVSYEQSIHSFYKEEINILLHPGKTIKNNKYKTENALINAVSLGAILLTSDTEPYCYVKEILKAKNTIEDWEKKIEEIIEGEINCEEHYEKQCEYVKQKFDSKYSTEIMEKVITDYSNTRIGEILSRVHLCLYSGGYFENESRNEIVKERLIDSTQVQLGNNSDAILEQFLSFSKIPKKALKYQIYPHVNAIGTIGLILAYHERKGQGTMNVQLLKGRKVLAESSKRIEEIKPREINYFELSQAVYNTKKLTLKVSIQYEGGNEGMVGLYENRMRKKFVYRVVKKITGIQLPTKNLPYFVIR